MVAHRFHPPGRYGAITTIDRGAVCTIALVLPATLSLDFTKRERDGPMMAWMLIPRCLTHVTCKLARRTETTFLPSMRRQSSNSFYARCPRRPRRVFASCVWRMGQGV